MRRLLPGATWRTKRPIASSPRSIILAAPAVLLFLFCALAFHAHACAASACAREPRIVVPLAEPPDTQRPHRILVASHGWHTGLIVPASLLVSSMPELAERFGDAPWYEIGWGDRGFYQAQDITVGLALRAMFWSEGAVMHVVGVPRAPERYFTHSEIVDTCLSDAEHETLRQFLVDSFGRDERRRAISMKPGIYGNSQFYEGAGRYFLTNTCNTWTAKGLRSAGLDIDAVSTLTAGSLMARLRGARRACATPSATASASHPSGV